jgi:general stress protein YciG
MTPEALRAVCSKGGKAVHASGKRHKWTHEGAIDSGHKGGMAVVARHGLEHMRAIGSKGGRANPPGHMQAISKLRWAKPKATP